MAGVRWHGEVSRLAAVDAWPVNVPLEAPYLMAPGVYGGMSRTVVRITTEDGVIGLGEGASPHDAEDLRGELGQALVGRDADSLREALGRAEPPRPEHRPDGRVLVRRPLAAVEVALHDVAAREAGVPLHARLGDLLRPVVPFTEYFAYREGREETPAAVARHCARMVEEHGADGFEGKVAVRDVEQDVALVREVRAAIGAERALRLDANMGWRLDTARRALAALEPFGVTGIEEPVGTFAEMAALRATTGVPMSAHTPDPELAQRLGAPDALVVGVAACGGIEGTRRFAARCAALGLGFWFYSGDLGIATAAQLHLAAGLPALSGPSQSLLRWTADDVIVGGPFVPEGGAVAVPDGPGLGVELDPAALRRAVERYARDGPYRYYDGPPLPRH